MVFSWTCIIFQSWKLQIRMRWSSKTRTSTRTTKIVCTWFSAGTSVGMKWSIVFINSFPPLLKELTIIEISMNKLNPWSKQPSNMAKSPSKTYKKSNYIWLIYPIKWEAAGANKSKRYSKISRKPILEPLMISSDKAMPSKSISKTIYALMMRTHLLKPKIFLSLWVDLIKIKV